MNEQNRTEFFSAETSPEEVLSNICDCHMCKLHAFVTRELMWDSLFISKYKDKKSNIQRGLKEAASQIDIN